MESYIIYAVLVMALIYTFVNYMVLDRRYVRAREKGQISKELKTDYNIVATSYLVQLGCVMVATMILF